MNPKLKPAALLSAFEKLTRREKLMVGLGLVALPAYLLHLLWLGPVLSRKSALETQLVQAQAETARLAAQTSAMEGEALRQEGAKKGRVEALKRDMAVQERRFQEIEARMVPAGKMSDLLQSLLRKRPGLQLLSLSTLPPVPAHGALPTPVSASAAVPAQPAKPSLPAAAAVPGGKLPATPGDGMFLHGVELKVEGNYGDLLAWLSDLENMPQKMLWVGLNLKVQEYPRSTLVLKLQTLSRETTWLQL
jgi:MSHA biogenesis protein MshJ